MSIEETITAYKNKAVIYKLTSPSGKIYIGQTVNIANRFRKYLNNNSNSIGKYLKSAIDKYGFTNFSVEILKHFDFLKDIKSTKSKLDFYEKKFIVDMNCLAPFGYNLTGGGLGSYKRVVSEETKSKLSTAKKGKQLYPPVIFDCPNCGKICEIKQHVYRLRKKRNSTGKVFCSIKCSSMHQHSRVEKVAFSEVSYASDVGSNPTSASMY